MEGQEKSKLFRFLKIDSIIDNLTGLIEARLALAKLEIKEEIARLGARIIAGVVFSFLAVMIVIFFSITAAALINTLLNSMWAGYAIITGFYLLVLVLLIVFKVHRTLQQKIEDNLIDSSITDKEDERGE